MHGTTGAAAVDEGQNGSSAVRVLWVLMVRLGPHRSGSGDKGGGVSKGSVLAWGTHRVLRGGRRGTKAAGLWRPVAKKNERWRQLGTVAERPNRGGRWIEGGRERDMTRSKQKKIMEEGDRYGGVATRHGFDGLIHSGEVTSHSG